MRQHLPTNFTLSSPALSTTSEPSSSSSSSSSKSGPHFLLTNPSGHRFGVHYVKPGVTRVVHTFPFSQKEGVGSGNDLRKVAWEERVKENGMSVEELKSEPGYLLSPNSPPSPDSPFPTIKISLQPNKSPRLSWYLPEALIGADTQDETDGSFCRDSETRAYAFDKKSGGVWHYVERENHLPVSESEPLSTSATPFVHPERNEFVYGLGESRGSLEKSRKKFTLEGRDSLGYDWENGDPLYKVHPWYCVYNKKSKVWYGIFYNSLVDAIIDTGSENDVLWGCFRSYKASRGPLDYYLLTSRTLPTLMTLFSSLLSPTPTPPQTHTVSPTLPPLSQFGYLSSSLSLAAEPKAQEEIIKFLKTSREKGFPVDGLYLSSGWCQDEVTQDRNYFSWNTSRYPTPSQFGKTVEKDLAVQVIVNVKPWLLNSHPMLASAQISQAFVGAAEDEGDESAESWVWSSGFGCHKLGRYFDYSSKGGSEWWKNGVTKYLLEMNLTGVWIDNNEMAGLVDDDETFAGDVGMWNAQGAETDVEKRMGWGGGSTTVGAVGKSIQTMGMARATYEALIASRPNDRPVIVSRSGVPGIQAYAHASWSGDNSTTWDALKYGTKMTLSVGLSFGPGLYGHDIGGFAGKLHPSPELLVRWCQNGAWHSRFTVHSWKEISTTLWMYENEAGITDILRSVLANRYRLAPTFYSLYVTHYHRRGWPILKPLLWNHSDDPNTLKIDEDFIFGSHVLVASVTEKGARTRSVYLPAVANDGETGLQWCELDTGKWRAGEGKEVVLDAPLERTPVLVRAGGILVLGGECTRNIYDGINERTVLIFPSPTPTSSSTINSCRSGTSGSFTLIEDDFKSNGHTQSDEFTEIVLSFQVITEHGEEVIEVDYQAVKHHHTLPYRKITWKLPAVDQRRVVAAKGKEVVRYREDGTEVAALRVV